MERSLKFVKNREKSFTVKYTDSKPPICWSTSSPIGYVTPIPVMDEG